MRSVEAESCTAPSTMIARDVRRCIVDRLLDRGLQRHRRRRAAVTASFEPQRDRARLAHTHELHVAAVRTQIRAASSRAPQRFESEGPAGEGRKATASSRTRSSRPNSSMMLLPGVAAFDERSPASARSPSRGDPSGTGRAVWTGFERRGRTPSRFHGPSPRSTRSAR